MALPTIYFDTGGHAQGSGSTDSATPTVSAATGASVTGSVVTLGGAPNLSGVLADGSQTIFLNDATNSNQKIFKITAVDNSAKTVTVDVAPTGSITNSAWGIGGQFVYDSLRWEGAAAPGWTFQFNNSPASKAADFLTVRVDGDSTGFITVRGKTGVRPVLTVTNTSQCIDVGAANNFWWFENLELAQQGASGVVINQPGRLSVYKNVKISDGGGSGLLHSSSGDNGPRLYGCEISGVGGNGLDQSAGVDLTVYGCYIHDLTGAGIGFPSTQGSVFVLDTIIDTCGAQGIYFSVAITLASLYVIDGCTIYGCGNSGIEVTDADTRIIMFNTILMNNGNASGEYNVEWVAGSDLVSLHEFNLYFQDAGTIASGAANLLGHTAGATELTSDPLFVDAANGDFRLQSGSPAKGVGFPGVMPGGLTRGFRDIGAAQRQDVSTLARIPPSRVLLGS